MLLAVDVGNTHTVLGLYDGATLAQSYRIESSKGRTADEILVILLTLLDVASIPRGSIDATIIASVVPALTDVVGAATRRAFGHEPMIVGPGIKTGMPLVVDNPAELGADRIANAVAGWQRYREAVVIVDFGTGTNIDVVNAKGEYLGGAIAPGLELSMDALFARAAKLARVELKRPERAIGKNTHQALQSGLLFGYAGLVDSLVERMKEELATSTRVLATGGLAFLFDGVSRTIESYDEFLTLDGLRILYNLNQGAPDRAADKRAAAKRAAPTTRD